jgi:hypothetical protein
MGLIGDDVGADVLIQGVAVGVRIIGAARAAVVIALVGESVKGIGNKAKHLRGDEDESEDLGNN